MLAVCALLSFPSPFFLGFFLGFFSFPFCSAKTPAHPSGDFKFKDYAPTVFRALRSKFGIDAADYMLSLAGSTALRQLNSPGKSGSVFFLSGGDVTGDHLEGSSDTEECIHMPMFMKQSHLCDCMARPVDNLFAFRHRLGFRVNTNATTHAYTVQCTVHTTRLSARALQQLRQTPSRAVCG